MALPVLTNTNFQPIAPRRRHGALATPEAICREASQASLNFFSEDVCAPFGHLSEPTRNTAPSPADVPRAWEHVSRRYIISKFILQPSRRGPRNRRHHLGKSFGHLFGNLAESFKGLSEPLGIDRASKWLTVRKGDPSTLLYSCILMYIQHSERASNISLPTVDLGCTNLSRTPRNLSTTFSEPFRTFRNLTESIGPSGSSRKGTLAHSYSCMLAGDNIKY
jgi:hypothetical protein